jgi:hypothetical protein
MRPSAVFESTGIVARPRVSIAALAACVAAAVLVASASATSPSSRACPTAPVVDATLGLHAGAPVATRAEYSKTCTYAGGILPTRIIFQVDTASTFAAGEKAAASALPGSVVKVNGLGQAAWTTKSGGSLYVFDNGTTIKILALLTPTPKLEALARKLL